MSHCIKCVVSGKVQGVWFRGNTQTQAQNLGISGYAHNLPDGRVEVLACGPKSAVDDFCAWLANGPANAAVTNVTCAPADDHSPAGIGARVRIQLYLSQFSFALVQAETTTLFRLCSLIIEVI